VETIMEETVRIDSEQAVGAGETQGARRASGVSPARAGAEGCRGDADVEVLAKAARRQFSAEYKRRILREAAAARQAGEIGALLRREGLYSSYLNTWQHQRERGELAGLSPRRRGRKEKAVNPLAKRVAELERDKQRLERKLKQAELLLDIQKKASQLLQIPLASLDEDGSD
jgi:transposase